VDKTSYTKNKDPWTSGDTLIPAHMNNFETIYTEASSYLASHNHDALYPTKSEMQSTFWYAGNDGPGSGSDADLLYKSTGNLHASSFAGLGVPTGLVILWYGSVASIPSGWHLCDGTSGTIDLRGKFPLGSGTGASKSVGTTGGSSTFTATGTITVNGHALTVAEMGSHRHPFQDAYNEKTTNAIAYGGTDGIGAALWTSSGSTPSAGGGSAHGHTGTTMTGNAVTCLPFALALCYIQKI
jgi:hypothetical protein